MGVWIETIPHTDSCIPSLCHTLRGCVDWNVTGVLGGYIDEVTPCVGVWIETISSSTVALWLQCHTLRGCVDWNITWTRIIHYRCHTLRGCVDWNWTLSYANIINTSHTLRGCVDWNQSIDGHLYQGIVTPCVGVWIETAIIIWKRVMLQSHTLRGCVDWNNDEVNTCIDNHSHTLRGCIWIEALFTRWSSLWKNCKHSASCVFLFKLL